MPPLLKPTIHPQTRTLNGKTVKSFMVYCGTRDGGKGIRFYRSTREAAERLAKDEGARAKKLGALATALTPAQAMDAAEAIRTLQDAGVTNTLARTAAEWLEARGGASTHGFKAEEAFERYFATLDGASDHGKAVKNTLVPVKLWATDMADINRVSVETFLAPYTNPKSFNLKLGYILAFLNWARKNGMYPTAMYEDCVNIGKRKVPYKRPEFFMPETVELVMHWMEEQVDADSIAPFFALAFFAGVRPDEIFRMKWGAVRFKDGEIRVEGPKGIKGTPPRVVTMSANLKAWLLRYQLDDDCPVCAKEPAVCAARQMMCSMLGIGWPRDVARHTFCTAHAAMHRDISVTARELGHVNGTGVLKAHYWSTMDMEDAKAFWAIMPKGV